MQIPDSYTAAHPENPVRVIISSDFGQTAPPVSIHAFESPERPRFRGRQKNPHIPPAKPENPFPTPILPDFGQNNAQNDYYYGPPI